MSEETEANMGEKKDHLRRRAQTVLMPTYRPYDVVPVSGKGARVQAADGKTYLDFLGGIAVNVLGHCPPPVVEAVEKQLKRLMHVSNLYLIEPQIEAAERLVNATFADRVFFCNSGAESIEGAIKLARKFSYIRSGGSKIISMEQSFHGRTLGALAATGQPHYQEPFRPVAGGFTYVPFGDIEALEAAVDDETCAVMLEPIQGEAGVRVPPTGYLAAVRELCDQHGLLLILDEVQVGMGRTGTLLAHEQEGIEPDIVTLAKALGGGLPIGAVLARDPVAGAFEPGDHASTFGGNPVASAAAVAVLDQLLATGFLKQVKETAGRLERGLNHLQENASCLQEIRGRGLIRGLQLENRKAGRVRQQLEREGLLVNAIGDDVIRLTPPLNLTAAEVDEGLDILTRVLAS